MTKLVKGILVGVVIIIIAIAGKFGYDKLRDLKSDRDTLYIQNSALSERLAFLEKERDKAWTLVDSLDKISFHLELAVEDKELEIRKLRDSLNRIPDIVAEIPADDSYDYLQIRYPDDAEKEFDFSEIQVKSIHVELASYDLLQGINTKLVETNQILKNQIITKESIEEGLLAVIENYKAENILLNETILALREGIIKVRVQRNVLGVIVAIIVTVTGIIIAVVK